jgi:hypothetical protein
MAGAGGGSSEWTYRRRHNLFIAAQRSTRFREREAREDCLMDDKIEMATALFNESNEPPITKDDVRGQLYAARERYRRICFIADHALNLGFSKRMQQISMTPDEYANWVQVCRRFHMPLSAYNEVRTVTPNFVSPLQAYPEDAELINRPIEHWVSLYLLFGYPNLPGRRRRRRGRYTRGEGSGSAARARERGTSPTGWIISDSDREDFVLPTTGHISNARGEGSGSGRRPRGTSPTRWIISDTDREDFVLPTTGHGSNARGEASGSGRRARGTGTSPTRWIISDSDREDFVLPTTGHGSNTRGEAAGSGRRPRGTGTSRSRPSITDSDDDDFVPTHRRRGR